ncbi:hypothetical protein B0H19DRAFT_12440 [Mycena capillaripes]|nr:hypothetical protein B0H19DRAFT_12440 [Mycena capillaripes]
MNGWLKRTPYFPRLPRFSTRKNPTSSLLFPHRRDFTQTCRAAIASPVSTSSSKFAPQKSQTPLSDILSSSRVFGPEDAPFIRRAVLISNTRKKKAVKQVLDLVSTGPLEYVKTFEDKQLDVELSFFHGHSATQFVASSNTLLINGDAVSCTLLPYRPLDPVVALAVEKDHARRTLLLCKRQDSLADRWTRDALRQYFGGVVQVEDIAIRRVNNPHSAYREIATVHFLRISSAIQAHARIRADPQMTRVHVAYGTDKCELPTGTDKATAVEAALKSEPRHHPTYLPYLDKVYQPFTTVTLSNIHEQTTLRDLCKRIYGGPLYSIELHPNCTAVSTEHRSSSTALPTTEPLSTSRTSPSSAPRTRATSTRA